VPRFIPTENQCCVSPTPSTRKLCRRRKSQEEEAGRPFPRKTRQQYRLKPGPRIADRKGGRIARELVPQRDKFWQEQNGGLEKGRKAELKKRTREGRGNKKITDER